MVSEHVCPFCRSDPFEYVDVGVGMVPVAVTCCELGMDLYSANGDPHIKRVVQLLESDNPRRVRRGKRRIKRLNRFNNSEGK